MQTTILLFGPVRLALATTLFLTISGCATWSYDHVDVGREWSSNKKFLPARDQYRTDVGVAQLSKDKFGKTQALVVLIAENQNVAGKLLATKIQRAWGWRPQSGYRLVAEVDPELAGISEAGPMDTLRLIAAELTEAARDRHVREIHSWVAAGLIRLLQRWPDVSDEGPAYSRIADLLEFVPPGGTATIRMDNQGHYHFEYVFGTVR